ncbi:MAG: lactonase family protein [Planctomycetes bacterium]|nr:lactonase family protein [Planctomycetota bacterium]
MNRYFVFIVFLCACLFLSSCANLDAVSSGNKKIYPFAGEWEGGGIDSEGNEFTFVAKVTSLGGDKYRVLILDKFDTQKSPMHVMDGVMNDNKFVYTSDGGAYVGGGELDDEIFKGYYKGSVDGTYEMRRIRYRK